MSKIFTRTYRVRFSETNANGWVSPTSYLQYIVETAYDWGDAAGRFGYQDSETQEIAWVIRETEYTLHRPLRFNEIFDFTIWMLEWKRVRGWRAFELRLKDNDALIAQGTQQLVSLDSQTLRPKVPPESSMDFFRIEDPRKFDNSFSNEISSRFPVMPNHPQLARRTRRFVEWRDLDEGNHVNNAIYSTFVEEAAVGVFSAAGWPPTRLKQENLAQQYNQLYIKYHLPAVWNDELEIITDLLELREKGGLRRVLVRRPADEALILECYLNWQLVDSQTLHPAPLPEDLKIVLRQELAQ